MKFVLLVLCLTSVRSVTGADEGVEEHRLLVNLIGRARNMARLNADVYDSLPDIEESFHNLAVRTPRNTSDEHAFRNMSARCAEDMVEYMADFLAKERYALQMLSSNGRIAKDFTVTGSCQDIGTFGQCLAVVDTPTPSSFNGEYCLVGVEQDANGEDLSNSELLFFRFGFCVPDSCSEDDVVQIIRTLVSESKYSWNVEASCIGEKSLEAGTIVFVCLVGTLVVLVILSTIYDMITKTTAINVENKRISDEKGIKHQPSPDWKKAMLVNFSLFHNVHKLTAPGEPDLIRINGGLRAFSIQWSVMTTLAVDFIINERESLFENPTGFWERAGYKFWYQPIVNILASDIIVITFASSQAYLTLKELKRYGKIYWLPYCVKHYCFVTIPVIFNILVIMFVVKYIQGPYWNIYYEPKRQACDDYWWTHLIYMNNMIPFPSVARSRCVPWAWLLAMEMKLYFLNIPFVFLLRKSWKKALCVLGAITIVCSGVSAALAAYFGHSPSATQGPYNDNYIKHFGSMQHDILHDKFWNWWPAFLASHFLGYLIFVHEERKFKLRWYYTAVGWCLSTFTALSIVYGLWPTYVGTPMPQWESVLYVTYKHTAFCAAVCWVIFACLTGHGGPFKTYLMSKIWVPIGRSAYSAYLLHKPLIAVYMYSLNRLFFYTTYSFIHLFLAMYVFVIGFSLAFNLCVDTPIYGIWEIIERWLYRRRDLQAMQKAQTSEEKKRTVK